MIACKAPIQIESNIEIAWYKLEELTTDCLWLAPITLPFPGFPKPASIKAHFTYEHWYGIRGQKLLN